MVSIIGSRVLAPEEQHVYSPKSLINPAPLGAECNVNGPMHMALRWSAQGIVVVVL